MGCSLEVIGEERRLPSEVRLAIYRIVQEALHNAMRHARADQAVVRIERTADRLRVTVQDDGSGFDLDSTARRSGLGLMSMRERASSIGASFEIISRTGSGTAIVVERSGIEVDLSADAATLLDAPLVDSETKPDDDTPVSESHEEAEEFAEQ
jgi:signal transduction histidine kinase